MRRAWRWLTTTHAARLAAAVAIQRGWCEHNRRLVLKARFGVPGAHRGYDRDVAADLAHWREMRASQKSGGFVVL